MARRKTKQPKDDPERVANDQEGHCSPAQAALDHGGYRRGFVTHVETNTKATAFISSHDPVERWLRDGRLSDSQEVAILAVRRLWRLTEQVRPVTANYGERIGGTSHIESRAITEIEAREDLHRMQEYVPKPYWDVWENCCRHGMSAGVAGAELGFGTRSAQDRAHQIVCQVADTITWKEGW